MKKHPEYQYLDLCQDILDNGADKELFFNDVVLEEYKKKGENPPFIRSVFGRQIRFDMSEGFPLLTTKKTFFLKKVYLASSHIEMHSQLILVLNHLPQPRL